MINYRHFFGLEKEPFKEARYKASSQRQKQLPVMVP